jgi:hypothetical protein
MTIPPLPRHCGSWIIVNRATGVAICETYDRRLILEWAEDDQTIEVLTSLEYLQRVNARIREGKI